LNNFCSLLLHAHGESCLEKGLNALQVDLESDKGQAQYAVDSLIYDNSFLDEHYAKLSYLVNNVPKFSYFDLFYGFGDFFAGMDVEQGDDSHLVAGVEFAAASLCFGEEEIRLCQAIIQSLQ
jgi:hypothetical protein